MSQFLNKLYEEIFSKCFLREVIRNVILIIIISIIFYIFDMKYFTWLIDTTGVLLISLILVFFAVGTITFIYTRSGRWEIQQTRIDDSIEIRIKEYQNVYLHIGRYRRKLETFNEILNLILTGASMLTYYRILDELKIDLRDEESELLESIKRANICPDSYNCYIQSLSILLTTIAEEVAAKIEYKNYYNQRLINLKNILDKELAEISVFMNNLEKYLMEYWINKGIVLAKQGKYDEAILVLDKAIQINPQLAEAWHNKGVALRLLGRTTEADAAFAKAKELGYVG